MYSIFKSLSKFLKASMTDYCNIETIEETGEENISVFVNKDLGLSTVFEILGTASIIGEKAFLNNIETLITKLDGTLSQPGFTLQFVFARDAAFAYEKVSYSMSDSVDTAERLGLDLKEIFEERKKKLGSITSSERCYLVATTNISSTPAPTVKQAIKDRAAKLSKFGAGVKQGEYGQSPFFSIGILKETHLGLCTLLMKVISEICTIRRLDVYEALNAIRFEINPAVTDEKWRANLLGDKIPVRGNKETPSDYDISHILNPDIAYQLFNQSPVICQEDNSVLKMGGFYVAPFIVDIPAKTATPFTELFNSIPRDTPWRISITITSGHAAALSKIGSKNTIASLLSLTSGINKLIKSAADELIEIASSGEVLCMTNIEFCTWGESLNKANKNKQVLMRSVQNWGNIEVMEESGDPIEAWCNTIPALSAKRISNSCPLPLVDILSTLPLTRPASYWDKGSILYRTVDNKIYSYTPGSSKQAAWVDLYFAPPGYGKSFLLAASNIGFLTMPGLPVLPRLSIIDIGFSSSAFVEFVKSCLPENQKHLAQCFKLKMTSDFAINVFDTPLGCRMPLSIDREFLVNFLSLVLTPAGSNGGIERLPEVVGMLIDSMYNYFSSEKGSNPYDPGVCEDVDKVLENYSFRIQTGTTWWDVVDYLAGQQEYTAAIKAQKYAVPTLSDATTVLTNDTSIKDIFGKSNSNIIDFINSMVISAIKEYPILSLPTVFDIGEARVIAMDLSEVAKSGSPQADKKTGLMYLLAKQASCKSFYRDDDTLQEIPFAYREYHKKIIDRDKLAPKKIAMDEFHRTSPCPQVRNQANVDIREGRKFDTHIALLSQRLDDFDDAAIELANNIYILSKGTEETINKIKAKFNPSSDAITALKTWVTGPTKEGSSMLYLGKMKGLADVEQIICLTLGASEMWAYSTTHQDVYLRKKLSAKIGLSNALAILSGEFPGGSAKDYILTRTGETENSDEGEAIYDTIINELIIKHKHLIH
jgi:intracellular multiplication protein IcmB